MEPMRRKDRALSKQETVAILEGGRYGVLSTVGEDGYPYGVPMNYVYQHPKLYFHCAINVGQKLKNIANEPKVCFTVVPKAEVVAKDFSTNYESAIVFGKAKLVEEGKEEILKQFIDKYSPEFEEQGVAYIQKAKRAVSIIEMVIEDLSGKARR